MNDIDPADDADATAVKPDVDASTIQLDQFLKLQGIVQTGGEAKHLIKGGDVTVNDEVELRRGRKLTHGDIVKFQGREWAV